MNYYEILVSSSGYRGTKPLTYASTESLTRGSIVVVPLKDASVMGVVTTKTKRPTFTTKQITEVKALPPLPTTSLALVKWLADYYASPIGVCMQQLLPSKLTNIQQNSTESYPDINSVSLLALSKNQRMVVNTISDFVGTHILRGETGSGKTRVYVELAAKARRSGKSSIVLTPEIGLTPQLSRDFIDAFGQDSVIVTHSRLTQTARNKLWIKILCATKPLIIIGPRSALFSPISNVGLIVVDESHEGSYRQENMPHYNTNRVASQLAKLHSARLVLGSATPDIGDYYLANKLGRPVLYMPKLSSKQSHLTQPDISLVDMKNRTNFSRSTSLSDQLLDAITAALKNHEQTLLFLNRRGTARLTLCNQCGWQALCPHCDLPLTFHADKYSLNCHTCGYSQPAVSSCPTCHNPDIHFKSAGTKAIAEEIAKLFPEARVRRFDTDNTKNDLIENHYSDLHDGKIDILVGTQLIAKGLDLPRLSVVGVVMADTTMYFPDYSTDERTYQLLHQVSGRVGRGYLSSKLIVQTHQVDNPVIKLATEQNWTGFYDYEIAERKKFGFPPFYFLLKLTCKMSSAAKAEKAATDLKNKLLQIHYSSNIIVDGPVPGFHEKQSGKYNWQLVVKSKDRRMLLDIINNLPSSWSHYIDPPNLL